jgi:1L-myo-inositol 1-phosphate cytidylyltransferase
MITDALILMAGTGSRLREASGSLHKPLVPIRGRPLVAYIFDALCAVGIDTVHAVVGWESARLLQALTPLLPPSLRLHPIDNPEWKKQNGVSLLSAAPHLVAPFLLMMGDHLFEPELLQEFVRQARPEELSLAIDRKIESIFDLDDAMKVKTRGDRVVAIGKQLPAYDAIDTGIFLCPPEIFRYLKAARQEGDCSLADGVRAMAEDGKVRAIDIGERWWQDVDDPQMLAEAERSTVRLTSSVGSEASFESEERADRRNCA